MSQVSIKGIIAGLILLLVLSTVVGYAMSFEVLRIYEELSNMETANIGAHGHIPVAVLVTHPHYLPLILITTIATTGLSAAIAAMVSKRSFVLNALIIGIAAFLLGILMADIPLIDAYYVLMQMLNIGVAYIAGTICARRRKSNSVHNVP